MNRATVLISGAGQIGSRHLQGLATCAYPLDIYVHDTHSDSLRMSHERWEEVAGPQTQHRVTLHDSFRELPRHIDVAVVATPAHIRPQIISEISGCTQVTYWVLEKLLGRSEGALKQIGTSIDKPHHAWVNTPRRSLLWHQEIKAMLARDCPMTLRVYGGAWGLACNAIHFLDMFAWWTDETLAKIYTDNLEPNWVMAKRPGNMEVMGTLEASFSGGSHAQLTVQPGDEVYAFEFSDGTYVWNMDELAGSALRSDGTSVPGRVLYQSEVTGLLVEELLKNGTCQLTSLEESIQMHSVLLHSLLLHWQKNSDATASEVPIT